MDGEKGTTERKHDHAEEYVIMSKQKITTVLKREKSSSIA